MEQQWMGWTTFLLQVGFWLMGMVAAFYTTLWNRRQYRKDVLEEKRKKALGQELRKKHKRRLPLRAKKKMNERKRKKFASRRK